MRALNAAYDSARTVYETYKVTQAQLDDAQQALAAANDTALALLEGKEALQAQIELAQQLLDSCAVGSDTGNVSQEAHDALAATIAKAQDALDSTDASVLSQAAEELKQAAETFTDQIITTDKSELNEWIAKAACFAGIRIHDPTAGLPWKQHWPRPKRSWHSRTARKKSIRLPQICRTP